MDGQWSETLEEMTKSYKVELDGLNIAHAQFVDDGAAGTPGIASIAAPALFNVNEIGQAWTKSSGDFVGRIGAVASILLTRVVGGLAGLVVSVLSTIISSLFGGGGQSSQEDQRQRQSQELQMRIRTEIASKIASALRPSVAENYENMAREMLEQLRSQVGVLVAGVEADITKSRQEIEARQSDAENRKAELRTALDALAKARQLLEALA